MVMTIGSSFGIDPMSQDCSVGMTLCCEMASGTVPVKAQSPINERS